jgi:hypothetical protein
LNATEVGDLYATGSIAPTIPGIIASVTDSTDTMMKKMDSAANSQAVYGLFFPYKASSPLYSVNAQTHRVLLTGLSTLTRHYFAGENNIGALPTFADQIITTAR